MQVYNVTENGSLRKTIKVDFNDTKRVYLIELEEFMYLWQGQEASKRKKDLSLKSAKKLNEKRKKPTKIEVIQQNNEFGSFLEIMNALKKGKIGDLDIIKRPELDLEIEDTKELIEAGLEPDLIAEINLTTYELVQEKKDYKQLCRELAELQLSIIEGKDKVSELKITKKLEEIFKSSSTYEEICWLISELKILYRKNYFKKKNII